MADRFERLEEDVLERDPSTFPVVNLDHGGLLLHAARVLMDLEMDETARKTLIESHETQILLHLGRGAEPRPSAWFRTVGSVQDYVGLYRQVGFPFTPHGERCIGTIIQKLAIRAAHLPPDRVDIPIPMGNRAVVNFLGEGVSLVDDPEGDRIVFNGLDPIEEHSNRIAANLRGAGLPLNIEQSMAQMSQLARQDPDYTVVANPTPYVWESHQSLTRENMRRMLGDSNLVAVTDTPVMWQTARLISQEYRNENGDVVMTSEPMNVAFEPLLPSFSWDSATTPLDAYIRSVQTGVLFTGPLLGFNQAGLVQEYLTSNNSPAASVRIQIEHERLLHQFVTLGRVDGQYPPPAAPALNNEVHWLRSRTDPQYGVMQNAAFDDIEEPLDMSQVQEALSNAENPPGSLNHYTGEQISEWFRDDNG